MSLQEMVNTQWHLYCLAQHGGAAAKKREKYPGNALMESTSGEACEKSALIMRRVSDSEEENEK